MPDRVVSKHARHRWSPQEDWVLDRYVHGLLTGRYSDVSAAARECCRQWNRLGRARRGRMQARTYFAIRTRMADHARQRGRGRVKEPNWSPQEKRVLDAYARAVQRGRFGTALAATRAYCQDLVSLARKYRKARWPLAARSQHAVYRALLKRLNALGRQRVLVPWSGPELQLLDRYVRRLVNGQCRDAKDAARQFLRETGELWHRHPRLEWLRVRRTFVAAHAQIVRRAQSLGRFKSLHWGSRELAVVDHYVHALLAGRFRSVPDAYRECRHKLAALRRDFPSARWAAAPRTTSAVLHMITERTVALARRWPGTRWTPQELRVVERFSRALVRGRYPAVRQAAAECQGALERLSMRYPRAQWLATRRPFSGTYEQVRRVSLRLGRVQRR